MDANALNLETDPRFPSGPWTGFFLQPVIPPGRHPMELVLTFRGGGLTGEGRDRFGDFTLAGRYALDTGRCEWLKQYVGKHNVSYNGFNEGKGIWGKWQIADESGASQHGGFHIWPEGMEDPTQPVMEAEAEPPMYEEPAVETEKPELAPVG